MFEVWFVNSAGEWSCLGLESCAEDAVNLADEAAASVRVFGAVVVRDSRGESLYSAKVAGMRGAA